MSAAAGNAIPVARTPAELDGTRLTAMLRSTGTIAPMQSIIGVRHERIGNGLMSDSFRLFLDYDGEPVEAPHTLVGKFAAADPTSKATAAQLQLYRTELRFYEHLAHTVDVRCPRVFYSDIDLQTHDFVLLMDDQAPARAIDQITGCSLGECRNALRELARLHGPRWNDPQLAEIDWLQERTTIMYAVADQLLPKAVSFFLEHYRERLQPGDIELIEGFVPLWPRILRDTASPKTLVHTDFRPDNLLFDVRGEIGSVVVLDWAGIQYASGLLDVGYFIGSALSIEQRRAHERELVAAYFDELRRYPLGGYDWDACWQDYRRFPFFGLFTSLIAPMMVERTERSDVLFVQMAQKFCDQIASQGSVSAWK